MGFHKHTCGNKRREYRAFKDAQAMMIKEEEGMAHHEHILSNGRKKHGTSRRCSW